MIGKKEKQGNWLRSIMIDDMEGEETLDKKEKQTVYLSASIASGCQPCTKFHLRKSSEAGLSDVEINKTIAFALSIRNDATRSMESFIHNHNTGNYIKEDKQESLEKLQAKKKESTTVCGIMLYINYLQQLSKDIEDQALRVHRAVKLVDQKRLELVSIMQKRKTLKTIKHKEKQAYQQKSMQNERKSMDELASTRHARQM